MQKRNRKIVSSYMESIQGCELYRLIEGDSWTKTRDEYGNPNPNSLKLEPHHIFGGCHRWDLESNIVAVCRPVHDWAHKNRQSATVVSIWLKLKQGVFDRELIRECMGFDPIGVIAAYKLEEWTERMRMDVFGEFWDVR
jgi:hypothetical protein